MEMKKFYNTEDNKFGVRATKENDEYVLVIAYVSARFVATKHSRKAHIETDISSFEKRFANRESANKYFLKIKENHKTLKQVDFWSFEY